MLKIPEPRDKAKKSLGDNFDIRQFREVVLSNGSGPLDVREEFVGHAIKSKQAG
jgi:uncharacterized protein (DUF885 family)